jgi:hypothetical protein
LPCHSLGLSRLAIRLAFPSAILIHNPGHLQYGMSLTSEQSDSQNSTGRLRIVNTTFPIQTPP